MQILKKSFIKLIDSIKLKRLFCLKNIIYSTAVHPDLLLNFIGYYFTNGPFGPSAVFQASCFCPSGCENRVESYTAMLRSVLKL